MREIVWDTETTGLDPESDRICEIGAVELFNHLPTGRFFHEYINPERPMPQGATRIHGLTDAFLSDKPRFASIADAFLDFVGEARLVAHNARFDMGMLNAELRRLGRAKMPEVRSIDTREIAARRFPGAQGSLDALCRRFGIDLSAREKHGALLDSELLAEVYLELRGGRQQGLALETVAVAETDHAGTGRVQSRPNPLPSRLTGAEMAAHGRFVEDLGSDAIWARFSPARPGTE